MNRRFYSASESIMSGVNLSRPTGTDTFTNKPEGGKFMWASGEIESGKMETWWTDWTKENWESKYMEYKYLLEVSFIWDGIFILDSFKSLDGYLIPGREVSFYPEKLFVDFRRIGMKYSGAYLPQEMLWERTPEGYKDFREWSSETLVIWDSDAITSLKQYIFPH